MYTWARLARVLRRARREPRLDPLDVFRLPLQVGLADDDTYRHLNNGRYLTLCDLGRYEMVVQSGMYGVMRERGWLPVVAAATVKYRRSLELWDRFVLTTRIVYWDEKWFYIEHGFEKDGTLYAKVLIKGVVRSKEGRSVGMGDVIAALGETERPALAMPEAVRLWKEMEGAFK